MYVGNCPDKRGYWAGMPAPLAAWQAAQAGTLRSGKPPRQIFWPRSTSFSWPAVAGSLRGCCARYSAMFCISAGVRFCAMAVIGVGLPPAPLRTGSLAPCLIWKSANCLARYSWGCAARLGFTGMVLLPAAP
ncbi:hypothetical protein D3C72_1535680 [compost metagenome]